MAYTEEKLVASITNEVIVSDDDTREEDILDSGGLYPYDVKDTDIDIREDNFTVFELIRKRKQGKLTIPNFQRNSVWKHEQKSQFIESIILNFPIPPFYFNQTIESQLIIVDGLQRTTTLYDFLNNDFSLTGLRALPELNGKFFNDLNDKQRIKIEDKKLNVYKIMPSVPLTVVYDIFNRINTGGTPLTRQEVRNCIFTGQATELLKSLSSEDYFKKAIGEGISPKRMKDQEAILRYLAFRILNYKNYSGDMSEFLENAMRRLNLLSKKEIIEIKKDFRKVMVLTTTFFKEKNFRLPTKTTRGRINIAILESVAYFFSIKDANFLIKNRENITINYQKLLKNNEYLFAVRTSTGNKNRVKTRFEKAKEILEKTHK